jgi:hypothetical protein
MCDVLYVYTFDPLILRTYGNPGPVHGLVPCAVSNARGTAGRVDIPRHGMTVLK